MLEARSAEDIRIYESIVIEFFFLLKITVDSLRGISKQHKSGINVFVVFAIELGHHWDKFNVFFCNTEPVFSY